MKHTIKLFLCVLLIASCSGKKQGSKMIQGAGATFPAPVYAKLFAEYAQKTEIQVSYQAVGSGSGILNILNGVVDFGATDAFMDDVALSNAVIDDNVALIHLPQVLASVNFTYNIPVSGFGIQDEPIYLNADIIYKIYSGEITHWNDPLIVELNQLHSSNKTREFPDLLITPVYRSDSSGTTYTVTEFLAKASSQWADVFGVGKTVNWQVGIGQKGNSAVMSYAKQNQGAIGYVDYVYAMQNNFPVAKILNHDGYYVIGDIVASSAAAAAVSIPDDTRVSITFTAGKESAPMTTFSYILVRQEQNYNNRTREQAIELVKLLQWMYTPEAQEYHEAFYFAPLPENVIQKGLNLIQLITYDGVPVVSYL